MKMKKSFKTAKLLKWDAFQRLPVLHTTYIMYLHSQCNANEIYWTTFLREPFNSLGVSYIHLSSLFSYMRFLLTVLADDDHRLASSRLKDVPVNQ